MFLRHWATLSTILGVLSSAIEVRVQTSFGTVVGENRILAGCDAWLGIPYAEPPVADLRFAAPQPWQRAFDPQGLATLSFGAQCVQMLPPPLPEIGPLSGSEDCLFLNVWRPNGVEPHAGLAVMFWIHGGAFELGAGAENLPFFGNLYDGCKLASEQQVVVVSVNYRLGPFGFAAFRNDDGEVHTNFAMQDQREALRWIRKEVANFGGDPEKITIFGESAGGISVFHHTVSPLSHGLFRASLSESGFPAARTLEGVVQTTHLLAGKLGCGDAATEMECLRKKDVEALAVASQYVSKEAADMRLDWLPVIDGVELPVHPLGMLAQGRSNPKALMAGTNTDEGNLFLWPLFPFGMSGDEFKAWAQGIFHNASMWLTPAELEQVFTLYPATSPDIRQVAARLFTDFCFLCPTQLAVRMQSRYTDAFLYRFNWPYGCEMAETFIPGSFHGIEMPYVFGHELPLVCSWGPDSEALSSRMMRAWGDFAKHLDPSHSSPGSFPMYSNARQNVILQGPADGIEDRYRDEFCQLWDDVAYSKVITPGGQAPQEREIIV